MKEMWVGADPGGLDAFGLAFLDESKNVYCHTVSSVDEAVDLIKSKGQPLGLGIDAPMWWSTSERSARCADKRIRDSYGLSYNRVQWANSLRGAALIGGAMLAFCIRQEFPGTPITETHPKAVLRARKFRIDLGPEPEPDFDAGARCFARQHKVLAFWKDDHQRDAIVGSICAREGFEGRWTTDLAKRRCESEQNPFNYCLNPIHYFWPEAI